MRDDKHCFDREKCRLCFACADRCFSRALEPAGKDMTVAEVLAEVEKDRVFYEESGGGMTLSGGEPTMQFDLARDLLQGAREMGISTCVETCGLTSKDCLLALIPLVDLFLWDIKDTDPGRHLANTDAPLAPILENLREVDEHGGRTLLRCILIPDVNLNELHLDKLADIYLGLRNCEGIELLAYHRMGASKLERLGLQAGHMYEEPDNEQMDWARDYLRSKWGVHAL